MSYARRVSSLALAAWLSFLANGPAASAESLKGTITGTVKDKDTGQPMAGLAYDERRAVERGRRVPARLAVLGDLARTGPGRLELTVKLVHLGSGEILSMSLLKIDEALLG